MVFFTILRSIPNKAVGIITMSGAIAVLFLIPFKSPFDIRNTIYRPDLFFNYFIGVNTYLLDTKII